MVERCRFRGEYRDLDSRAMLRYECHRDAGPSGRCIFHDETSHVEAEDIVREAFLREFRDSDGNGFFIGCNIPAVREPVSGPRITAIFSGAHFHGPISFANTRLDTIDFSEARFCGELHMHNCRADRAAFEGSRFGNHPDEDDACPDGVTPSVRLEACSFDELDMSWSFFAAPVIMKGCNFTRSEFSRCEFRESLSVDQCTFRDTASFRTASFWGTTGFTDTSFASGALFRESSFIGHMDFHRVDFQDQRRVTMPVDMSDVSLLGTDVARVRFEAGTIWDTKGGLKMFDVRKIEDGSEASLAEALSVCRNMRENRDYYMDYSAAAKFFEWEMEMQRQFRNAGRVVRRKGMLARVVSMRYAYKIASDYGESIHKIMGLWAALVATSFAYFFTFPDAATLGHVELLGGCWYGEPCGHHPVPTAVIHRALDAMGGAGPSGSPGLVFHAATLLVLGMSFIAVRRRLERRPRH
ncbi:MAG: pentapeptide repeat-containing protein [Hyphomicrobiaceae bacterium]|nr:pentapeptide repeat-containing protein [Hyphomicrobiaceae bacterium]